MAISFVAASAVVTGANPTVAVPAGYALGDLLVIITTGTATPTTPSGWTSLAAQGATGFVTILYKFAAASESSVAITLAGTTSKAVMVAYRGVSATDTISAFTTATGTTLATATLTTTYANGYVISVYGSNGGAATNWTAPASTTARVTSSSTAALTGLLVVDEAKAAAGVSTARTATVSASRTLSAVAFSITSNDRYWVGGSDNWDGTAGTKWSTASGGTGGAPVPTSADNVFINAASGANTVTISTGNTGAKSLNCTGFTGTLAGSAANISIAGSLTFSAGMTITYNSVIDITGTATITSNGQTPSLSINVNAPSGTVTLGDALSLNGRDLSLTAGTFNTNGFSVTAASFISENTNTRTLTLNSSTLTFTAGASAWRFSLGSPTFNCGTSTIVLSGNGGDFSGGGFTYYNVIISTSTTTCTVTGANTYNSLTLNAPSLSDAAANYEFVDDQTTTTLIASGSSPVKRVFLSSSVIGTARTITATTWTTVSDVDFRDITLTNAKSGTRLGDCGGNTNITFDAAKTVYWNLAGAQNWSATGWATTSGGTPAANNFPLAQDTAVFDNTGSVTGAITVNSSWNINSVDMSARTSAMTLTCASSNRLTFYGNLVTGSGTTFSGTGRFVFSGRAPQTITTAGKTVSQVVEIASAGSTVTLQDALTLSVIASGSITLTSGTFDLGGYNVTITSGSFNGDGTTARTLAFSGSTLTVGNTFDTSASTNLSVTGSGTIRLTSASQKSCAIGSADYSGITVDQAGAGLLVFNSTGTIGNISNSYASTGATSIRFDANPTVGNFTASGQAGRVLTITSSIDGLARTLTKTSGIVNVNYLSIRDSTATGGATFYAGPNSTNVSNNTGWIFAAAPSTGNFMAFFI